MVKINRINEIPQIFFELLRIIFRSFSYEYLWIIYALPPYENAVPQVTRLNLYLLCMTNVPLPSPHSPKYASSTLRVRRADSGVPTFVSFQTGTVSSSSSSRSQSRLICSSVFANVNHCTNTGATASALVIGRMAFRSPCSRQMIPASGAALVPA